MRTLTILTILLVGLAGCIAPPGDAPAAGLLAEGVAMTAKESRDDAVDVCRSGLPLVGSSGGFCAERTVLVEGTLAGLARMDVDLSTFNGPVEVFDHKEGQWSLKAVLRARGATAEEARANLEKIAFTWTHVDGAAHVLYAKAQGPRESSGLSASLFVNLPRSVDLVLSASTSNGQVQVKGVSTDGLSAQTSNGGIELDATVTQVSAQTSNGKIEATLRPESSGRITLSTSNGAIDLTVPEDARHGYDLSARTSNGKVTIDLRDGEVRRPPSNPYYDPQNEAEFTSRDFRARAVQSMVELTTSNGAIDVNAG